MDDVDLAQYQEEQAGARALAWQRHQARLIQPGSPGDCELCGEWSARLVGGACAPCRDRYKLP